MKLSALLPLAIAATTAYASSLTRRNNAIQARQAKVQRSLVDVCASLDVDLTLPSVLKDGKPVVTGHIGVCLCLSVLPDFVKSHPPCQTASLLIGADAVVSLLEGLIHGCDHKQTCTFPDHSTPACAADNQCAFGCTNGYSSYTSPGDLHPSACHCLSPNTECNGKCGSFPHGCGSATPQKRRLDARADATAASTCPSGHLTCGVAGNANGWDCVDPKTDKESCGGCVVHNPFFPTTPHGQDCSAIEHVDDYDCVSSKCIVKSCKHGYVPSPAADICIIANVARDHLADVVAGAVVGAHVGDIVDVGAIAGAGVHIL